MLGYTVVFDRAHKRIGFATSPCNSKPASTNTHTIFNTPSLTDSGAPLSAHISRPYSRRECPLIESKT